MPGISSRFLLASEIGLGRSRSRMLAPMKEPRIKRHRPLSLSTNLMDGGHCSFPPTAHEQASIKREKETEKDTTDWFDVIMKIHPLQTQTNRYSWRETKVIAPQKKGKEKCNSKPLSKKTTN